MSEHAGIPGRSTPTAALGVEEGVCRTMDFHRAEELIDLGRKLTTEALEDAGY